MIETEERPSPQSRPASDRPSRLAMGLVIAAVVTSHAAFGIGLWNDSLGPRSVLMAMGTAGVLLYTWTTWRNEDDGLRQLLPITAFLAAPVTIAILMMADEATDNDALQAAIAVGRETCDVPESERGFVSVDVIEVGGASVVVLDPPRGFPDDLNEPSFADRALDPQTGNLRATQVLCMAYPRELGSGPQWCTGRVYELRSVASSAVVGAVSARPTGPYETVDQQRFCEFQILDSLSPTMSDVVTAAVRADQPLERFLSP